MNSIDKELIDAVERYVSSGIEQQIDYEKFYLYSIITHSTAIEGSTVTEIENQLLFDEGISVHGKSMTEQLMNLDLKNAYTFGFQWIEKGLPYSINLLCELSAAVMKNTGSKYSTIGGEFDSSKGDLRLCNVSAGFGGASYLSYQKVANAVKEFCDWLNERISNVDKNDIAACYRLSFDAHYKLVTIHPWVDGNGRTTRLLMNMVQRQLGLIPSIVTKEDKAEYLQALIDSRENDNPRIIEDVMIRHHINNLNKRAEQYLRSVAD